MAEQLGGKDPFGDFLLNFLGHAALFEMLKTIHETMERNPDVTPEEIITGLNERMIIPEQVDAVLNYDDKTRTRRREIG